MRQPVMRMQCRAGAEVSRRRSLFRDAMRGRWHRRDVQAGWDGSPAAAIQARPIPANPGPAASAFETMRVLDMVAGVVHVSSCAKPSRFLYFTQPIVTGVLRPRTRRGIAEVIPFRATAKQRSSAGHMAGRARCAESLPQKTSGGRPYSKHERRPGGIGWVARCSLMLLVFPCYHWRNSPAMLQQPCRGQLPGTKGAASPRLPLGTEVRMTLRHVYVDPRQIWGGPRPRHKTNAKNPPVAFSHQSGIGGFSKGPEQPRLAALGRSQG